MSNDNGGQAFPRAGFSGTGGYGRPENGMTLRDYFAAKAMQGLIASPGDFTANAGSGKPMESWSDFASGAYQIADAMLKEREK